MKKGCGCGMLAPIVLWLMVRVFMTFGSGMGGLQDALGKIYNMLR